jgi:hypothetical protein
MTAPEYLFSDSRVSPAELSAENALLQLLVS